MPSAQAWDRTAPIQTDLGIDLVADLPRSKLPLTFQVQSTLRRSRAGLKGMALDCWLSGPSRAELVALVELQHERIRALTHQELAMVAQAASAGRLHVFVYTDRDACLLTGAEGETFDRFLLKDRMRLLFGRHS